MMRPISISSMHSRRQSVFDFGSRCFFGSFILILYPFHISRHNYPYNLPRAHAMRNSIDYMLWRKNGSLGVNLLPSLLRLMMTTR
jgi:hypothetical protein